jgi:hypothetical protein
MYTVFHPRLISARVAHIFTSVPSINHVTRHHGMARPLLTLHETASGHGGWLRMRYINSRTQPTGGGIQAPGRPGG